ncbi:hypothetical protein NHX12_027702 [Muraenolepis orangiensis]|uniref:Uncharacterized protein n=1 Tax=Muraenolepis orangiensis TaxID=630683 RepID=A0A9Q0EJG6_9TELE|nr:hypothetical protein NHX12_027702 [Muraenolepis orangiensis]
MRDGLEHVEVPRRTLHGFLVPTFSRLFSTDDLDPPRQTGLEESYPNKTSTLSLPCCPNWSMDPGPGPHPNMFVVTSSNKRLYLQSDVLTDLLTDPTAQTSAGLSWTGDGVTPGGGVVFLPSSPPPSE